jgi:putative FmdB family regulatory protein
MPIFEFRCPACSTRFEKIVFRGEAEICCPGCGRKEVEKLLSSFAVGSGSPRDAALEPGPCPCGAAQRGMCQTAEG